MARPPRAKDYLVFTGEYKTYGTGKSPVLNKYLLEAIEAIDGSVNKTDIINEMQKCRQPRRYPEQKKQQRPKKNTAVF